MVARPTIDGGPFGPPKRWRRSDLIAMSEVFDADLVLTAYRHGVFPMPTGGAMGWYSPVERGVLPLAELRVTRSLRKAAKHFEIRVDTAFDRVLDACGDPSRPHGWIDDDVRRVYRELYAAGNVHSVEAWTRAGELAGGLYGVSIGGLFAGESMFHRPDIGRDASKVALLGLVDRLSAAGDERLLDVQWRTPHLASLGVIEIPREDYLARLERALHLPGPDWTTGSFPGHFA
jgi:leucyl/phenylalanyl-tRNA--protein transferase